METKVLRLSVSLLTAATLFLVSCGQRAEVPSPAPAPTPTPTAPAAPAPTPAPAPAAPTPAPATEKPKYGGTFNRIVNAVGSEVFDNTAVPRGIDDLAMIVYEQLADQDWAKGLAGTGEVDWGGQLDRFEGYSGELAESWEIPEVGTWVFKIRRGVRWALDPTSEASRLVNGREFTADDVVWNINRLTKTPGSYTVTFQPAMSKGLIVEKTGPWEVTLKNPIEPWVGFFWVVFGGNAGYFWPREVIEKYGNATNWRNTVGTGAWMLTDYVSGSVATHVRNQNYWRTDPIGAGKGNRLPYLDTVKTLIVPDISTRLAAMRTGRADWVTAIEAEDARSLIRTSPQLKFKKYLPAGIGVTMRVDKPELPFKDKRVRHALMMATDFESLKKDLYLGDAEILVWPIAPSYDWLYTPMEKLPESTRALYKYSPERAKQLLAEAGYPNGFKTRMVVQAISTSMDPAAALKAMWAKVGIDVEIQPMETAVYLAQPALAVEQMRMSGIFGAGSVGLNIAFQFSGFMGATSYVQNTFAIDTFKEMQKYIFKEMPKADELYRKFVPYAIEQAYVIPRPSPYSYTFWQPWVKNHYGETRSDLFLRHAWVDQDLKEQSIGRR